MRWSERTSARMPVARSVPNHGASTAAAAANSDDERSALDGAVVDAVAAAAAAAAADCVHYYCVYARDDCVGAVHAVTQAREAVGFAGAGDRGMIRTDGEAQGTTRVSEGASQMRRTSSSLTSVTSMSAGTEVC